MSRTLLDTDILSDFLRGKDVNVVRRSQVYMAEHGRLTISAVTIFEVVRGAFVFLSTHAHFLLSPTSPGQLALFMQFVNANVAKEAGRLHRWRERFWSRRYRSIVVADEGWMVDRGGASVF